MLKLKVASLDGISAEDQKHYVKAQDGALYLQTESVDGLVVENVMGLKSALEKERQAKENVERQLADAKKAVEGVDLEEAKVALNKYREIKDWNGDKKIAEAVEANKRELVKVHETELKKARDENHTLIQQLEEATVTSAIDSALAQEGGNPKLMRHIVRTFIKWEPGVDGKRYIKVIGDNGQPRVGNASGDPMTVVQLVQELKQQDAYSGGFTGVGSTGGGGNNGNNGSNSGGRPVTGKRVIPASDLAGTGASLEDIAVGKVIVDMAK